MSHAVCPLDLRIGPSPGASENNQKRLVFFLEGVERPLRPEFGPKAFNDAETVKRSQHRVGNHPCSLHENHLFQPEPLPVIEHESGRSEEEEQEDG